MAQKISDFTKFSEVRNFTELLELVQQLAETIDDESDPLRKAELLCLLGRALERRFELGHQIEDLQHATNALNAALDLVDDKSDQWNEIAAAISHVHGTALRAGGEGRYILGGIGRTRSELYTKADSALSDTPADSPARAARLYSMAFAHLSAFIDDWATVSTFLPELSTSLLDRAEASLNEAWENNPGDALAARIHCGLAECLVGSSRLNGSISKPEIAHSIAEKYGEALALGAKTQDWLLCIQLAQASAEWFGNSGDWDEAANQYRVALRLAEAILDDQEQPLDREPWLSQMVGLGSRASFAFARNSNLRESVNALETVRGNWGFKERVPNIPLDMISQALQLNHAAIAYFASTPWGSVVIFMAPDERQPVNLSAYFINDLTEGVIDEFLGMSSGAMQSGARPGERTPWHLLSDFLRDNASTLPTPPSLGARESVLKVLHESLGIRPGTFLQGYLSVVGHESPGNESEDEMYERFEKTISAAQELTGRIVRPLYSSLRRSGASTLILVPDTKLALLPLHASVIDSEAEPIYLADVVDCRIMNSAKLLLALVPETAASVQNDGIALIANPNPGTEANLPWAELEVRLIRKLVPGLRADALSGDEASVQHVREILPSRRIAHFACHASFDPDFPWNSYLQLADGELTAQDMGTLFGGYDLVVMSACQSAVTAFKRMPDEMLGLPMSALLSGSSMYVGALWAVNDLSTAVFFAEFYRLWDGRNESVEFAINGARRALRSLTTRELQQKLLEWGEDIPDNELGSFAPDERPFSHPYFWAPFVLYGVNELNKWSAIIPTTQN
jgi:CHAT domain-containing protein/tetratricopeptide (TPR) repeat protein